MTTKNAAGKVLLALYYMQAHDPVSLRCEQVTFRLIPNQDSMFEATSKIGEVFKKLNLNENELYNAFNYLLEKGLISHINNSCATQGSEYYRGPRPTALGIDVVEGVERKEEGPQKDDKNIVQY